MKQCEKCSGTMVYETDVYGEFYTCIMCGKTINIKFSTLFSIGYQKSNWGVQTKTKKITGRNKWKK
tara:strand:+ start:106 stop:303 length:198 start_codon:yes stop_codon:yes gene_type:complete